MIKATSTLLESTINITFFLYINCDLYQKNVKNGKKKFPVLELLIYK